MLEIIGTLFTSILSGGATGLIGVVAQRWADYKNKQLDIELQKVKFEHELSMREADAKLMQQEWAGRLQVAAATAEGEEAVAANQALAASFAMEPQRYATGELTTGQRWLMVLLDLLRGIVRPGLTLYLCVLTTLIYQESRVLLALSNASEATAAKLTEMVVGTVLYLTVTCVLWWFGTRNRQKPPKSS
jgi:hypothetical protein